MQVKLTISDLKMFNWWTKLVERSIPTSITNALGWSTILYLMIGSNCAVLAQSTPMPSNSTICDINLTSLKPTETGTDPNIITADTLSPQGMTIPSLWWTSEQLPPELVTNWIANRRQNQIYLLVNTQYWNILDYIDRYRTIDKFGRVAQSYGYNLKICNSQKIALAGYTCEATGKSTNQKDPKVTPQSCQIWLNGNDQNGMGVQNR
jgi:hypothetical protein